MLRNNSFAELVVRDQLYHTIREYCLESGRVLRDFRVAYKTWGVLNSRGDNVLVICHALTGSADAADWWGPLFGKGKVFDPDLFFIVCFNVLGSPYGSLSPLDVDCETGRVYGPRFPTISIRDNVSIFRLVASDIGIKRIQCVIGGSMGGMQVLEWAFFGRDYVRSIVPIATSARQSGWALSLNHIQRETIIRDPNFDSGNYVDSLAVHGLGLARMQALMTYRSHLSFEKRFGTRLDTCGENYAAHNYLKYQADKFMRRFDPNCYIAILDTMDTHDIARGRGDNYFELITPTALVVAVQSDSLFPPVEQEELHQNIPNNRMAYIESEDGHDGFLLEFRQLGSLIKKFLRDVVDDKELLAQWFDTDSDYSRFQVSLAGE